MRRAVASSLMVLMLASAGCASDQRTYYWSNSQGMFHPADAKLKRIIETSDRSGRRPPPGVLAEYGYAFFLRGEKETAVRYFEREAEAWPESAEFMKQMVEQARKEDGS